MALPSVSHAGRSFFMLSTIPRSIAARSSPCSAPSASSPPIPTLPNTASASEIRNHSHRLFAPHPTSAQHFPSTHRFAQNISKCLSSNQQSCVVSSSLSPIPSNGFEVPNLRVLRNPQTGATRTSQHCDLTRPRNVPGQRSSIDLGQCVFGLHTLQVNRGGLDVAMAHRKGPGRPPQPPVPRGIWHGVSEAFLNCSHGTLAFVSFELGYTCPNWNVGAGG